MLSIESDDEPSVKKKYFGLVAQPYQLKRERQEQDKTFMHGDGRKK